MISFFSAMIHCTSVIAMLVTLIFYVGILRQNNYTSIGDVYKSCSAQLKTCKSASLIFAGVYWFCVSGLTKQECLEGYSALSKISLRLGCIWIFLAVLNIVLCIIIAVSKKNSGAMQTMAKLRKSCFYMGIIFLVISYILKVG